MTSDDMTEVRMRIRLPRWIVDRLSQMATEEHTVVSKILERIVCKYLAEGT